MKFREREREQAKSDIRPDTLAYIEALEKVARTAFALWTYQGQPDEKRCEADLYDALDWINFLYEEEEP